MKITIGNNTVDSSELAIIGEYTTDSGPFMDDHFLAFILNSGNIIDCPISLAKEIVSDLEKENVSIDFKLCNNTGLSSRVIYPKSLLDRPLFKYKSAPRGLRRLLMNIKRFGVSEVTSDLTNEVSEYLAGRKGLGH
jgi:hypothetical protein